MKSKVCDILYYSTDGCGGGRKRGKEKESKSVFRPDQPSGLTKKVHVVLKRRIKNPIVYIKDKVAIFLELLCLF